MTQEPAKPPEETQAEKRLKSLAVDLDSMAAMSNMFRVTVMFRNYAERKILAKYKLSFSGFTVLWVLWIWGRRQAFELAAECGISKGTLTGVVNTLEKKGYAERKPHKTDARRIYVQLTGKGRSLMTRLFPRINQAEARFTGDLNTEEKQELIRMLRLMLEVPEHWTTDRYGL